MNKQFLKLMVLSETYPDELVRKARAALEEIPPDDFISIQWVSPNMLQQAYVAVITYRR